MKHKKQKPMIVTSFKAPKELIKEIRALNLNIGSICREALIKALENKD